MRTILIAALDAAQNSPDNAFFMQMQSLSHWQPSSDVQIVLQRLPCVFKHSLLVLEQLINQHKPSHLLVVAQNAALAQCRVEKVALNVIHASYKDNDGQQPLDSLTAQHGPAAYFSNLPLNAIIGQLQRDKLPAQLSYHAGTCVANHAYYGLMHYIKHQNTSLQGGLLQFPLLPSQACLQPGVASLSADLLLQILKTAITASLSHSDSMLRPALATG